MKTVSYKWSDTAGLISMMKSYKSRIDNRIRLLEHKIANLIVAKAQQGFNSATLNDGSRNASVQVYAKMRSEDGLIVVVAEGEDAVWVEFGAGVSYNGSVGTSKHPKGGELGFTIGSYGMGKGKRRKWGYYQDGELYLTRGTPTQMPLMRAVIEVSNDIASIAREVFA
jgi:hypothetical protein